MKYFFKLSLCLSLLLMTLSKVASLKAGLPDSLDRQQIRYLANLCQVWGLYKYYHPEVASGKVDWNQQLIRFLPKVYEAQNKEEYNKLVQKMLNKVGEADFSEHDKDLLEDKNLSDYNTLQFKWIEQGEILNSSNQQRLKKFTEQYQPQAYPQLEDQLQFKTLYHKNEINYTAETQSKMPRPNQRMLDLFTLWSHIHYFFPYRGEQAVELKQLLLKYIPRVFSVLKQKNYHLELQSFLAEIRDSHAFSYSDFVVDQLGRYSVPIELCYINDTTYVKEARQKLKEDWDIAPGHRIVSVNGTPIDSLRMRIRPYVTGAHPKVVTHRVNKYVLAGEKYSSANITLADRNNETYQVPLTRNYPNFKRENIHKKGEATKYLTENIAYLNTKYLEPDKVDDAIDNIDESKYLIIDLRNSHNEAIESIEKFLTPEKTVVQYYHRPLAKYPGKFLKKPRENAFKMFTSVYEGRVVFLINEKCKGHCELTAQAIEASRNDVTYIGRATAGAFGQPLMINLPFVATNIMYTGNRVTNKQGEHHYPNGIQPDKTVHLETTKIRKGQDIVLQKAIEYFKK